MLIRTFLIFIRSEDVAEWICMRLDIPDSLAVQPYPLLTENRLRWQSGEKRCLYSLFEQWREEAHLTELFSVFIMSEDVMGWGSWGWTSLII